MIDPTDFMDLDQFAEEMSEYVYEYRERTGKLPPFERGMLLPTIPSDIEEFKKDPLGWGSYD